MLTGFDLCRAAMAVADTSASEQSVLLVLALMANDAAQCFPPINGPTGLTAKTKLSERAVQRAIQRLCVLGHVSRRQLRNGVIYTVHPGCVPDAAPDDAGDGVTPATVAGVSVSGVTQAPRPATVAPKQPRTTKHTQGDTGADRPANVKPDQRGRRIDIDWQPTQPLPEPIAKVIAGWPPGRLEEELTEFRDFWLADAGQRATKLDWDRTWWNRLRDRIKNDKRREDGKRHGNRYRDRASGWAARPGMEGAEPAYLDD